MIRRLAIRAARFIVWLSRQPLHTTAHPSRRWHDVWSATGEVHSFSSEPDTGIYRPPPGDRIHTGFPRNQVAFPLSELTSCTLAAVTALDAQRTFPVPVTGLLRRIWTTLARR